MIHSRFTLLLLTTGANSIPCFYTSGNLFYRTVCLTKREKKLFYIFWGGRGHPGAFIVPTLATIIISLTSPFPILLARQAKLRRH